MEVNSYRGQFIKKYIFPDPAKDLGEETRFNEPLCNSTILFVGYVLEKGFFENRKD